MNREIPPEKVKRSKSQNPPSVGIIYIYIYILVRIIKYRLFINRINGNVRYRVIDIRYRIRNIRIMNRECTGKG